MQSSFLKNFHSNLITNPKKLSQKNIHCHFFNGNSQNIFSALLPLYIHVVDVVTFWFLFVSYKKKNKLFLVHFHVGVEICIGSIQMAVGLVIVSACIVRTSCSVVWAKQRIFICIVLVRSLKDSFFMYSSRTRTILIFSFIVNTTKRTHQQIKLDLLRIKYRSTFCLRGSYME